MSSSRKTLWRRIFSPINVLSVVAGVVVFIFGLVAWDTNRGVLTSALVGAAVTGIVWLIWWTVDGPPDFGHLLGAPRLGTIPSDHSGPTPTLSNPTSSAGNAYRDTLAEMEAHTKGHVVLVSSPEEGDGASTVALNLAILATQRGRRVALVDGDVTGRGVSRFLSTGPEPGLTDLAGGTSSLAEASRMWEIGPDSSLPVIPHGSPEAAEEEALSGKQLGSSIDRVSEHADAVIIDTAPVGAADATAALAAHADGTILVVTSDTDDYGVIETRDRLRDAGAPVIGYIENHAKAPTFWRNPFVRMLKRSVGTFAAIALVYAGFTGFSLYGSWSSVERQSLDTAEAAAALPSTSVPPVSDVIEDDPNAAPIEEVVYAAPTIEGSYRSFLLIGSDVAADLADVILLTVLPADEDLPPFMVSLPRDLYVPNRCTGDFSRINATYRDCGDVNAATMLALTVEDFTGIKVDNFATFDFDGFASIVDGVGGVEICTDYPMRDAKSHLDIPGGCINADGETALAWVRSRHTEQFVDGKWRSVPGASDLARNQHQQDVLIQLAKKLRTFESPSDLAAKIEELSNAFSVDDGLGITDAVGLAWSLRDLDLTAIRRLVIPVKLGRTTSGQSILRATVPFDEVLTEYYPSLLEDDTSGSDSAPANPPDRS